VSDKDVYKDEVTAFAESCEAHTVLVVILDGKHGSYACTAGCSGHYAELREIMKQLDADIAPMAAQQLADLSDKLGQKVDVLASVTRTKKVLNS
jgi:hypothetical protein